MHLGLRLLFAFLAITGVAAFFVLRVFVNEIKPSVREVVEDVMVDSANLLAEVAASELAALQAPVLAPDGPFAAAVRQYSQRTVQARIWGLHKTTLDLRITLTDAAGRVVFDSGQPSAVGQDHSRWRDVLLTLRGEYGARTTRTQADDEASAVMHVAAPVRQGARTLGVLVVAKPLATLAPFIERAERKVLWAGVALLGFSLAVGVLVTGWTVASVRRLRRYALQVAERPPAPGPGAGPLQAPALPGELGELAHAMDLMRRRLEGHEQLETQVRALTHELKSPLAAIRGATELLHEDGLQPAERRRFVAQVDAQARRLQAIVERLLELSKLEALQALPAARPVNLKELTDDVMQRHQAHLQQRALQWRWVRCEPSTTVAGDRDLLALALSNLVMNACAFAPAGSLLELALWPPQPGRVAWSLRDHGPGVPDYARPQLGRRYFSLAPPDSATRGSGLGLAIVMQIARLHGAQLRFEPASPGLRVQLEWAA